MTGPTLLDACIGGYRLVDFLGAGGMGEVYRAVHVKLGRVVAIKVLSGSGHGPGFLQRFENEARLQATLQHPNIATLYDFVEFNGRPSIVMEFVEGQSLADTLRLRYRLPAGEALRILADVASAVSYVHEKGIVHRDLKPGNIRITGAGVVKVLDFGIAKAASVPGLTQTGFLVGTPQYLAPEQFTSGAASPQSDVWSLGVLLYEMVTGRLPFEGDFAGQVWKQIDTGTYAKAADVVAAESSSEVDQLRAVDRIVGRCLKKNPSARYESARRLLEDVTAALRASAIENTRVKLLDRLRAPRTSERPGRVKGGVPAPASDRPGARHGGVLARASDPPRECGGGGPGRIATLSAVFERYWMAFVAGAAVLLAVLVISFTLFSNDPATSDRRDRGPGPTVHRIDVVEGRADVYVNGVLRGRTPFDYAAAANETVEIELRQPGFEPRREKFEIAERPVWTFPMQKTGKE